MVKQKNHWKSESSFEARECGLLDVSHLATTEYCACSETTAALW